MEQVDIVIIGAGWHGLAMAKTFVEVFPSASMYIFDSASSIGGVWASERLYPGLKTNNVLGSYEFSDFHMDPNHFGVHPGEHIPGNVVHDYLTKVAEKFNLTSRIRLRHRVISAELLGNGSWSLSVAATEHTRPTTEMKFVVAQKLVVATGATSEPYIPTFEGRGCFNRNIFHAKELNGKACILQNTKSIGVLGGNKSAWDTCFLAANAGALVHMVMRPNGGGPSWVWPAVFSPFKLSIQRLATTRFFTWFDPCIWADTAGIAGLVRYLLHQTFLGRRLVSMAWSMLGYFAENTHKCRNHAETQKLKPWVSPFWMGNSLSIHNYPSPWFDLVREGRITVHIADVDRLSEGTIHLSDKTSLQVDGLICCTGWKANPPLQFLLNEVALDTDLSDYNEVCSQFTERARSDIFARASILRTAPFRAYYSQVNESNIGTSCSITQLWRGHALYRFLIPPTETSFSQRNIAFIGSHLALNTVMIAQLQALWITAFFTNGIASLRSNMPSICELQYQAILHNEYSRMRHPHGAGGTGGRCPDLVFDCLPYIDLLCDDLGLVKYRKAGIWSEIFHRYTPGDFKGIVKEWLALDANASLRQHI